MHNYGLILKQLRNLNGYSLKTGAAKIGKSVGWLSEVENNRGLSQLRQAEFDRIVKIFNGDQHKELFKTWIAIEKTKDKVDRTLDGAVLKYIRNRQSLSLEKAAGQIGISKQHLANLENGHRSVKLEMRNKIMIAYGYSPTSFRNLTSDEKRAKSVPVRYKINILLNQIGESQLHSVFDFIARSLKPQQDDKKEQQIISNPQFLD